jgi:UDP-N-acetylmuramoyl-L-alanyl-D-glutamate--2,6-diaminopimelate ligase
MILSELVRDLSTVSIKGNASTDIRSIEYDSRKVGPDSLFLAIRGQKTDGNVFIPEAMKRGAAAILTDQPAIASAVGGTVSVITVPDARKAMALVANRFYGCPQESLIMTGITGTNGKTTTSYLVRSIFETAGIGCGLIGTIRHIVGGEIVDSLNTTPEAPDIHSFLARMADAGQGACVMEVSSHALTLSRIHGIRFRAAAFTNLTRDHLDFHGDFVSYLDAKSILFSELAGDSTAVINGDDPSAEHIKLVSRGGRVVTFGFGRGNDMYPVSVEMSARGSHVEIMTPWGSLDAVLSLPGRFNIMNAMTAAGIALACGIPREVVMRGLTAVRMVDGRFQTVEAGQDFAVIVDYAHTPDALERIIAATREITQGRLIVVFGCGGDRDRGKRPLMGSICSRSADYCVITSDNPRTEDPLAIIAEITTGMDRATNYEVIPDRASAIRRAVEMANAGDAVIIAGKGHENYQVIGTARIHFDDAELTQRILKEKR